MLRRERFCWSLWLRWRLGEIALGVWTWCLSLVGVGCLGIDI